MVFLALQSCYRVYYGHFFKHPQAANLVAFCSLIVYLIFLKLYLRTPLSIAFISLLAVPLIQIHTTKSYVDLPGNILISIMIIMNYLIFTKTIHFSKKYIYYSIICDGRCKY